MPDYSKKSAGGNKFTGAKGSKGASAASGSRSEGHRGYKAADAAPKKARWNADERATRGAAPNNRSERPNWEPRAATPTRESNYSNRGERPSYGDRGASTGRPSYGDRNSSSDRGASSGRPSYGDRNSSSDRGASTGRPSYGDRNASSDRGGRSERPSYGASAGRSERPSYGDRNGSSDRGASSGRPSYGDRNSSSERPSYGDRPARTERPAYGDRNDRSASTGRPSHGDRNSSSDRPSYNDRPARTERPAYGDRSASSERPSYGDRPARTERPAYGDRPARTERPAYGDRPARTERPSYNDRPARTERPAYGDRNDRGASTGRPSYGDRSGADRSSDRGARTDRPSYTDRPARSFDDRRDSNTDRAARGSDFYPKRDGNGYAAAGAVAAGAVAAGRFGPQDDVVLERLEAEVTTASDVVDMSFGDLGLGDNITRQLAAMGAPSPFPIQAATIPDVLAGKDVLGRGKTGSGKTIAFGAPLVERLMENDGAKGRKPGRLPRALILAPTRELAMQIDRTVQPIARSVGLFTTPIFGGVPQFKQVSALQRGTDIIIATPGRLEDLVEQGRLDLSQVKIVVLDEADHMCDLGFLEPVQRILRLTAPKSQKLLFSATLDKGVAQLVNEFLVEPAVHEVAGEDQA
ncbi:MAG: deaD, partial [Subtercola sp.]|nr:deaD [Subtercola sp.]